MVVLNTLDAKKFKQLMTAPIYSLKCFVVEDLSLKTLLFNNNPVPLVPLNGLAIQRVSLTGNFTYKITYDKENIYVTIGKLRFQTEKLIIDIYDLAEKLKQSETKHEFEDMIFAMAKSIKNN